MGNTSRNWRRRAKPGDSRPKCPSRPPGLRRGSSAYAAEWEAQTASPFFALFRSFRPPPLHHPLSLWLRAGFAAKNARSRKSRLATFRSRVAANTHRQTASPYFALFWFFRPPPPHHPLFAAASRVCRKKRKKPKEPAPNLSLPRCRQRPPPNRLPLFRPLSFFSATTAPSATLLAAARWLCRKERKKPFSRGLLCLGCRSLVLCGRDRTRAPVWTRSLDA
jgi:hypothetical protein